MLKKVVRKCGGIIFFLYLIIATILCITGKASNFDKLFVTVSYSFISLIVLFSVVLQLYDNYLLLKQYIEYKKGFTYLKGIHTKRYKLYFTGTEDEIKLYSEEIKRYGDTLIRIGEENIKSYNFSKNMSQKIEDIVDETKKLMTSIKPI